MLLEYQFTCHGKFKNAVNAIPCPELRLEPIGRDRAGRVYWLQLDHDANLRLYQEDQDEETWDIIARYTWLLLYLNINKSIADQSHE